MRVCSLHPLQDMKGAGLYERQRTQAFGVAQGEPERDAAAVGMTDEVKWRAARECLVDGCRLLGKAQRPGAMPASLIAVTPKIERHGLEAAQLLRESLPLPRGACRAGEQHDPIEWLWSPNG